MNNLNLRPLRFTHEELLALLDIEVKANKLSYQWSDMTKTKGSLTGNYALLQLVLKTMDFPQKDIDPSNSASDGRLFTQFDEIIHAESYSSDLTLKYFNYLVAERSKIG